MPRDCLHVASWVGHGYSTYRTPPPPSAIKRNVLQCYFPPLENSHLSRVIVFLYMCACAPTSQSQKKKTKEGRRGLKIPRKLRRRGCWEQMKRNWKKVRGRGRRRKKKKTSRDFLENNAIATNGDRPMSLHNFFDWTGPCRSCYQLPPDSKSIPWRNLPGARALSAIPMYTGCKWCWADVTLEKPRPSARAHVCETNMRVFVRWRGKLFPCRFQLNSTM